MWFRLSRSLPVWSLLWFVLISLCDESTVVTNSATGDTFTTYDTVCVSHLDVWAGVSSFSYALKRLPNVVVKSSGLIEWSTAAMLVLHLFHATNQWCTDFFKRSWEAWTFSHDLIVIVGPSCCPFSVSVVREQGSMIPDQYKG